MNLCILIQISTSQHRYSDMLAITFSPSIASTTRSRQTADLVSSSKYISTPAASTLRSMAPTRLSSASSTTSLSQSQIRELIDNYQTLSDSIETVIDKIKTVNSQKTFRILGDTYTCSEFIDHVTYFTSIANTVDEVDNIKALASKIENGNVETCSHSELSSLSSIESSLETIKSTIQIILIYDDRNYRSFEGHRPLSGECIMAEGLVRLTV